MKTLLVFIFCSFTSLWALADCEPVVQGNLILLNPFQIAAVRANPNDENPIYNFTHFMGHKKSGKEYHVAYTANAWDHTFNDLKFYSVIEKAKLDGKMLFIDTSQVVDNVGSAQQTIEDFCH